MEDTKPKDTVDRFLWMCCQKNPDKRLKNMSEVKASLWKLNKRHRYHMKSILLFGSLIFTIFISGYSMRRYDDKKHQIYKALIQQGDYEKAILTNSNLIEAYRAYLTHFDKQEALNHLEFLYNNQNILPDTETKEYLIYECMSLKNLSTARFANTLIQEMHSEFAIAYHRALSDVLQKKDCKESFTSLYTQIMNDQCSDSSVHKTLSAYLYECKDDLDKTMWMQLIQMYEEASMQEDVHRVQYAFAIWQIKHQDEDVMRYIQSLNKTWQSDKDLLLLSSLYMDAFESCISDEEKHRHLDMLESAKQLLMKMQEKEAIRENLQQNIAQLDYLMEKWRIYE